MASGESEHALDITGEDLSEGHVGTESPSLNSYDLPVVRGQNVNRAAARPEEDVTEPCSVVNRVVRNSNFAFIGSVCFCIPVSFQLIF